MEGVEPKMPGAPGGIQIMTPQQFVAKAGDMPGQSDWRDMTYNPSKGPKFSEKLDKMKEDDEQGVAEGGYPEVDHMLGNRGIGLDSAKPRDTYIKTFHASKEKEAQEFAKKNGYIVKKHVYPKSANNSQPHEFQVHKNEQGVAEGMSGQVVFSGTGADGGKYEIIQSGPTDFMIHANGRHIDTYGSLQRAMSVLKNEVPGLTKGVAEAVTPASVSKVLRLIQRHHSDWFDTYGMGEVEDAVVDMAEMGQFRGTSAAVALKLVGDELESMYGQQGVAEAKAKTQKKEVVGFRSESEFKTWKQYAQKEGYEIREAGNLPGSYAAFDDNGKRVGYFYNEFDLPNGYYYLGELITSVEQGVAESLEQLNRIRKLSGLAEATTLPASTRDLKGQEFQDYMNRIKGTDDIDKKTGQVKLDKKGNEKYVSGKTKSDKYKMPYIHRSSIIEYLGPDGKTYDEDKIKQSLSQRPKALLKQNEKMKHSNGEFEQFFNVGFAALTGIAVDESTDNLIIVNTCPGAGSCKVDCFAMKGGKVQFKAAWQSDGRILTYLLNDPSGFFNQLSAEISKEEAAGKKGDKKFPNGWQTTVRWHDAGDFFSPEYLDMALKMAAKHPDVKFYAYTKMAGAALAQKPPNFIINWSEGANTSQEKQVKAKDANLDTTKNSRIVPDDLFQDLLVKDEKKNLVKGASGQWQVQPDKLPELKQRLASEYGLSANSILSYDEYMAKRKSIPAGMKYNVIVAPGEGDISANDPNIISTLLLRH